MSSPNYLSPTAFRVIIPRMPTLTDYIQTVSIPSLTINSMDIQYKGFPRVSAPSSLDLTDQIVVNFAVDEDMENWQEVYDWMNSIVLTSVNNGYINPNTELYSDIIVITYTNAKKPKKKFTFHQCYPVSMMSFEFNSMTTEIDPIMVNCNFTYKTYEIETLNVGTP